jgi:GT2 family glycosyltransferase
MPIDAEIVVVDDSEDETYNIVKEWKKNCVHSIQLLHGPNKGLSNARNCALNAAKGELLVFTDDDCRLGKEYICDLIRYDAADTKLVIRGGGIERGDPGDLPITTKTSRQLQRWSRDERSARYEDLANTIYGCNMTMRRVVIDKIGQFDERFGAGSILSAGEDTDYLFRAYLAGMTIEYVPNMIVYHYHGRKTASEGNKLFRSYMICKGGLYAKHFFNDPDLCRQFSWDTKSALKEIISGKNTFSPEINFSHKDKVVCYLIGVGRYIFSTRRHDS